VESWQILSTTLGFVELPCGVSELGGTCHNPLLAAGTFERPVELCGCPKSFDEVHFLCYRSLGIIDDHSRRLLDTNMIYKLSTLTVRILSHHTLEVCQSTRDNWCVLSHCSLIASH
jgi:hypothetical protein